MRIIVVRHYRTVNNVERRIMGWGDAPPAEDWEDDLLHVDQAMRRLDINSDTYYSSALGRARRTARYYARRRGNKQLQAVPELNEVNYGKLYQRPKQWVAKNYREYKTDPDFVFPQGESFRQMQRRSVDFLLSLQKRHDNDTVMLVVHAGVIRGLISHFLDLDFGSNLKRKISHRYIGEFVIENDVCNFYNELGKHSGFVKDGVIDVPLYRKNAATCRTPPVLELGRIDPVDRLFLKEEESAEGLGGVNAVGQDGIT